MKTYKQFKKEVFKKRPGVKKEFDFLKPEIDLINKLTKLRLEKKMTQQELAEKLGTRQPAVSRFEKGVYENSLTYLAKVAHALNKELKIDLK